MPSDMRTSAGAAVTRTLTLWRRAFAWTPLCFRAGPLARCGHGSWARASRRVAIGRSGCLRGRAAFTRPRCVFLEPRHECGDAVPAGAAEEVDVLNGAQPFSKHLREAPDGRGAGAARPSIARRPPQHSLDVAGQRRV